MKITTAEKEILNSILSVVESSLHDVRSFGIISDYDENSEELYALEEKLFFEIPGITTAHGISKFVIIHNNLSFVIKIPFNGYWYDSEEDNNKNNYYKFMTFSCAHAETPWNYCEAEVDYYNKSIEADVSDIFAETEYYGTIANFFPVYLQEKIIATVADDEQTPISSTNSPDEDSLKLIASLSYTDRICNDTWSAQVVEHYGKDFYYHLIDFIHEEEIKDFHGGNVGYRLDGAPVIIDYSGFNDN